jgi:molybdopterin/thiamine biosynthesis adenylyltransferase
MTSRVDTLPPHDLSPHDLSPDEWLRYSRQIGPGALTREQQLRLRGATALVTRAGGMGGPAALSLVMAGIGRIIIAHSGDMIVPDLNRQTLGSEAVVGKPRAENFAAYLRSMNRFVEVQPIDHEPSEEEAIDLARRCDVLIASPPNFAERLRLNRAAIATGVPLVDAAQWGMTGTLIAVKPGVTACLKCVYPQEPPFEELFPVIGAISAATGSLAALEAIKIITGAGEPLFGRMLVYDGQAAAARIVELARDPECSICGKGAKRG